MTITKRQTNPSPYYVEIGNHCFWVIIDTLHNDIYGNPRRQVKVAYKIKNGGMLWARSYIVKTDYKTDGQIAIELAQEIVKSFK